ncbi:putative glycosyl transferase [Boseongicola aestuarii]|uniref:Putative glycosyl transferase n=2 Tax=Boseongicola aestuarii TaxID=1470561 RepID=A0A238J4N3_9RHOB|nr:putative glycosyl transferase [Boseongicola aestuarii]
MVWGTYDLGKPRTRLMVQALRHSGAEINEIHAPVWEGAEDKSVMHRSDALRRGLRWALAYPWLVWRFARAPRPDVVVVGYLGHLDVLILWFFARLRRVPVVWDAFLSLYDTVVMDRRMVSSSHPLAFALKAWEWLACRAATKVVVDTEAQGAFFRDFYALGQNKVASVFVGAEASVFPPATTRNENDRRRVVFYGQFIPLHGIATIVEAARLSGSRPLDWLIIGMGQQADVIREMLEADAPASLSWTPWVPYGELVKHIASADVCLGVFGASEKAGRVIPNKVFQVVSAGRPLVTRDGPGMRELVGEGAEGIRLVPPADPAALLAAVEDLIAEGSGARDLHGDLRSRFSIEALAERWKDILMEVVL